MNTGNSSVVGAATLPSPRAVFSLTVAEGVTAVMMGLGAGIFLRAVLHGRHALPVWFLFPLCGALAASAVCAFRFLRRGDPTRGVSRLGYFALAQPLVQAAAFTVVGALGDLGHGWNGGSLFAMTAFIASVAIQFVTACIATGRGCFNANYRGEIAVLPLFFAWGALGILTYNLLG